jgi:4'-phosphopantetheinyl transferase EntD
MPGAGACALTHPKRSPNGLHNVEFGGPITSRISCHPMTNKDPALQRSIDAMAVPGILVEHRVIASGDEFALLPEEFDAFATSVAKVRRASGAARIVARGLLARLGKAQQAIPRSASGVPVWPSGIVGSLAHDAEIAVAAVAMRSNILSVGVDVEPAVALDPDLLPLVATANERRTEQDYPCHGRLLFAVKEAVYKAVYPLEGTFLDHHDVEVNLASGTATVRNGRIVPFRYCMATHIVTLAFISVPPIGT